MADRGGASFVVITPAAAGAIVDTSDRQPPTIVQPGGYYPIIDDGESEPAPTTGQLWPRGT